MSKSTKPLGFYNYTVVLTYLGMLAGFIGISFAFKSDIHSGVVCLMIAGLCDMFDGAVAATLKRRTKQEKTFGIQIDSLSDLICFGVLPALLTVSLNNSMPVIVIAWLFVLCALIRLAYFNVDEQERQEKEKCGRSIYFGMPVTMSALLFPIVYEVSFFTKLRTDVLFIPLLLVMGIMFLTPFQLRKPKMPGKICMLLVGLSEFLLLIFICR